ncbi:hypothetical protein M404DRAFT_50473, partial [Pisolithus tinctorius Marx 270]
LTDYRAQGTTLDKVIIDLASARGVQHAYVMLSCAHSLSNLAVLWPFSAHRTLGHLQHDLHDKL